jgi:hypothetical protein
MSSSTEKKASLKRPKKRPEVAGTPAPEPAYPRVVETYQDPSWTLGRLVASEPTAFNGDVRIRRYRVTIERIEEPVEVLRDRLRALWRTSERNSHHWAPMRRVARELGMDPEELSILEQGVDHRRGTS